MATLPAAGYLENVARTNAEMKAAFEALRDIMAENIGGEGRAELTIASGAVTPAEGVGGGIFRLDTEGDAASDTLDTITTTNTRDGQIIILMAENAARVVTLNHAAGGSGQILLQDSTDFVYASLNSWVMLQRRSTDWVELMRWVPPEDLTALTASDDSNDLLRVWDDSAGTEKRIAAPAVGRILQIVHATDAGSSHSNTSYANLNSGVKSITPKSASSKILIEVSARLRVGNVSAVNAQATYALYESSAGSALGNEYIVEAFSSAGGLGMGGPMVIRHQVDSVGTSLRSFGLQGKVNNGSSVVNGTLMVWTITEYLA